jgi:hypothetical protein
VCRDW